MLELAGAPLSKASNPAFTKKPFLTGRCQRLCDKSGREELSEQTHGQAEVAQLDSHWSLPKGDFTILAELTSGYARVFFLCVVFRLVVLYPVHSCMQVRGSVEGNVHSPTGFGDREQVT